MGTCLPADSAQCVVQLAEQLKALTALPDGSEAGTPGTHRKQGSCEWASLGPAGSTHGRGHSCPGREILPLLMEPWLRGQGGVALGKGLTLVGTLTSQSCRKCRGVHLSVLSTQTSQQFW